MRSQQSRGTPRIEEQYSPPAELPRKTDWKKRPWAIDFITELREHGNVSLAAKHAHITKEMVYALRNESVEFREHWESALDDAVDSLEHAMFTRARDGVVRMKFGPDGKALVDPRTNEFYSERQYSDNIAKFLLSAMRPEKYRDRPPATVNIFTQTITDQISALGIDAEKVIEAAFGQIEGDPLALPEPSQSGQGSVQDDE